MNKPTTQFLGIALISCFSIFNSIAQQERPVGDFTGIKAGDAVTIILTQGETPSLKVDAPESVQSQIKTEVKEGILHISTVGNFRSEKDPVIYVTVKKLNSLDVSGAAEVKTDNQILSDKLSLDLSGAGDVVMDVKAIEISSKVSGAGDMTLKGSTELLSAEVSGAGNLKASNLEATKVKAKVNGAGDAKVHAVQSLDADVSGAGSIIYKGNPIDRNVNITGAGSVRESKAGTGEETASDTTKIKLGGKKFLIIGDEDDNEEDKSYSKKDSLRDYNEEFKHWVGLELGVNGLLDYNNSLTAPADFLELNYAKSIQFGLNLLEKDFHIYKNYINIVTGFGFDFNHYAFENNITLNGDTTYLWASTDTAIDYKKNTLHVSYIKVPLMIEINTSKNSEKNLHIAGGVEAAYRIHAVSKQKFYEGDKHIKIKQRDDFNLEPFRFSAIARIGYNNVTVFANYGLNRLFKKDKGPQVYPFTVGVTINM
ncbi:MAG: DUF2807 domain-containing protein [Bacteroidota bacterium]|nr:DUF2807 domain-containing protein [Bacteroidota bacterium]